MTKDHVRRLLRVCYEEASRSPDPSTQIGAIIVSTYSTSWPGTLSHNGPPPGWTLDPKDLERPRKYSIFEHAERRALYKAARTGLPMQHCTMISTWAACADCARGIVESGLVKLIRHVPPSDETVDRWFESVSLGDDILRAGGVTIENVYGPIPGASKVLRGETLWNPAA